MTASGPIRIGNAEREAAQQALDVHMTAGRLDPEEFGDRFARAGVAQTRADLDMLFTDLPEPHARPPAPLARPAAGAAATTSQALGGRLGTTIVAASPFIALILFFVFHSWLFFLLVPLSGAIVYGGDRRRDHDRSRTRRR